MKQLRLPHEPGTGGVSEVDTVFHRQVAAAVESNSFCRGAMLIDGPPGTGKTFSSVAAALALRHPVYWLALTGDTSLTAMYANLVTEITGEKPRSTQALMLARDVRQLLSSHQCWLFVDEAQWADQMLLRTVRSIYDATMHTGIQFNLVLLGFKINHKWLRNTGIWSRVSNVVEARDLTPREVIRWMPQYHPMFGRVTGSDLYTLWRYAGGNFRHWAHYVVKANSIGLADAEQITSAEVDDLVADIGKQPLVKRPSKQDRLMFEEETQPV